MKKNFKIWLKHFLCDHLWREKRIEMLKKIMKHPLDDRDVLYALEKTCLKCNKQKIVGKWVKEEPDFMKPLKPVTFKPLNK